MIPRQIIIRTVENLHELSGIDLSYFNSEGDFIAGTSSPEEALVDAVKIFAAAESDCDEVQGYYLFKHIDENCLEGILTVSAEDEKALFMGKIALSQLQELAIAYRDHFNRGAFIKNLLLGNLLLVDIYKRAKNLQIVPEVHRLVYLIETDIENSSDVIDYIRKAFGGGNRHFLTAMDERTVVLVQETGDVEEKICARNTAEKICELLNTAGTKNFRVAYGPSVPELQHLSGSYREAKLAMEIGRIFYREKQIYSYDNLGIGHLLYQLPMDVCEKYVKEVFTLQTPDQFDRELVTTADAFFYNNMNIAETARQLFVHRNTLIYRLDKLAKNTGLDIRSFEDAVAFKIGMMVYHYLLYSETSDQKK